jgi:hypothetical protein
MLLITCLLLVCQNKSVPVTFNERGIIVIDVSQAAQAHSPAGRNCPTADSCLPPQTLLTSEIEILMLNDE